MNPTLNHVKSSSENNLVLNSSKIKELIIDFWKDSADPDPLYINRDCMERVPVFKFKFKLCTLLKISPELPTPQQHSRRCSSDSTSLRKPNLHEKLLVSFYRCSIKSVLRGTL